jgi:hypothetical protein
MSCHAFLRDAWKARNDSEVFLQDTAATTDNWCVEDCIRLLQSLSNPVKFEVVSAPHSTVVLRCIQARNIKLGHHFHPHGAPQSNIEEIQRVMSGLGIEVVVNEASRASLNRSRQALTRTAVESRFNKGRHV